MLIKKMNQNLKNLQTKSGYIFKDEQKLAQALTHRSYLNENRSLNLQSNETYEFLGDSILEFWISDQLFNKFPKFGFIFIVSPISITDDFPDLV